MKCASPWQASTAPRDRYHNHTGGTGDDLETMLGSRDIRARNRQPWCPFRRPRECSLPSALRIGKSVRDDAKLNRIHLLWLTTPMQSYYKCAMNGSVTICGPVVTVLIEQEAACGN
jgi:hypothetical protein